MKPVLNEKFNLSSWALNHQQMVSFFMLLIIAMGAFCYENLPRNEDPAFTIKTAVVSAQWPGASVTDTTRLLTKRVYPGAYRSRGDRPGRFVCLAGFTSRTGSGCGHPTGSGHDLYGNDAGRNRSAAYFSRRIDYRAGSAGR